VEMNKSTRLMVFLTLLIVPLVSGFNASTDSYSIDSYHTGSSGNEPNTVSYSSRSTMTYQQGGNTNATTNSYSFSLGWFEEEIVSAEEEIVTTATTGGGGGGAGVTFVCSLDLHCAKNQYCFENACFDGECTDDSVCNVDVGEVCWNLRCVKLFDINIIEFESPINLGEFFDFTYFVKGVANIDGDVKIDFWIEQDGDIVTSGSDVVYFGSFEEKTVTTSLFLPSDVESGTYEFVIQVTLGTYTAQSKRTVEISVEGGVARLKLFDITLLLDDSSIRSSDELSVVVTFESFGNVPTPIDLTFIILDESGNEFYRDEDRIVVLTDEFFRKSFKGLNLPNGKYTLVLHTLYDVDVADEFRQEFVIRSRFRQYLYYGLIVISVLVVILVIVLILRFILRRKIKKKKVKRKKFKFGILMARTIGVRKRVKSYRERRRPKGELRKLQRIKEKEKRLIEKTREKAERDRMKELRKTERKKLRKEGKKREEKAKRRAGEIRKRAEKERLGKISKENIKKARVEHKRSKKLEQKKMKTDEIDRKIESLQRKKFLLKKGYRAGYINERAYQADMKKLEKLISRLRRS